MLDHLSYTGLTGTCSAFFYCRVSLVDMFTNGVGWWLLSCVCCPVNPRDLHWLGTGQCRNMGKEEVKEEGYTIDPSSRKTSWIPGTVSSF